MSATLKFKRKDELMYTWLAVGGYIDENDSIGPR